MGVCRAMALIGDTKQATSEGKCGPVETGLTGMAATALGPGSAAIFFFFFFFGPSSHVS